MGCRSPPLPGSELIVGVPSGHPLTAIAGAVPVRELAHTSWVVGTGAGNEPPFGRLADADQPARHLPYAGLAQPLRARRRRSRNVRHYRNPGPVVPESIALESVDDPNWLGRRIFAVTRNDGEKTHELAARARRELFENEQRH